MAALRTFCALGAFALLAGIAAGVCASVFSGACAHTGHATATAASNTIIFMERVLLLSPWPQE
jgi:hypothetical protein